MEEASAIKTLWEFLHMNHKLEKADVILVFGCHDIGVAEHSVKLFKEGWAPLIIFSGGLGKITIGVQKVTEADNFAQIALKKGIPSESILVETKSTNTRENVIFTKELLNKKGIKVKKVIIVVKPYMERRAYATFKKFWAGVKVIASAQNITLQKYLDSYPRDGITKKDTKSLIVGDLNRLLVLPKKGLQIKQRVPKRVKSAYEKLVEMGYTKYLWK